MTTLQISKDTLDRRQMTLFRLRLIASTETRCIHNIWSRRCQIHQRSDDCSVCKWVCQLPLSVHSNPVIGLNRGIHRLRVLHLESAQAVCYVFRLMNEDPVGSLIHL